MTFPLFPLTFGSAVAFPIKQTPEFATIVQMPASGRGPVRIPLREFPLWKFVIDISYLTGDAQGTYRGSVMGGGTPWQQLINFYMSVQGRAGNWLFLHPYDNSVGTYTVTSSAHSGVFQVGETIIQGTTLATANFISVSGTTYTISGYSGTTAPDNSHTWIGQTSGATFTASATPTLVTSMSFGTAVGGANQAFSMIRTFTSGGAQDLIQNFVGSIGVYGPSIYDNGTLVTNSGGTNYTIDQYGTITFTGYTPTVGHTLSWAGRFYYLCSFEEDKWDNLEEDFYQIWSMSGLKFTSVLL